MKKLTNVEDILLKLIFFIGHARGRKDFGCKAKSSITLSLTSLFDADLLSLVRVNECDTLVLTEKGKECVLAQLNQGTCVETLMDNIFGDEQQNLAELVEIIHERLKEEL